METISIVISAFNAEQTFEKCLTSLRWADQIIVIDNQSTDETAAIAKRFGATIFHRKNNPMLNVNKNFGFDKAKTNWILSIDSDEEVPQGLAKEIRRVIDGNDGVNGYWIARKNIIFGKWIRHGLWWPDKQLRLFKRGRGVFPCVHVHEYLEVDGKTEDLREPYIHYNYASISQYLNKMETIYIESEVQKHIRLGYNVSWMDALRFPISDFLKIYFAQAGYKDGLHGLILSLLQAFYSFLVFAKLWERASFVDIDVPLVSVNQELFLRGREISYWVNESTIHETTNPLSRFLKRLRRKILG